MRMLPSGDRWSGSAEPVEGLKLRSLSRTAFAGERR